MFSEDSWLGCCPSIFQKDDPCKTSPLVGKNDHVIATQQNLQQSQNKLLVLQKQLIEKQSQLLEEQQTAVKDEKETDDPVNEQSLKIGRIEFSIRYNFDTNTLALKILQAKNLEAKDIGGTSDPYVKVTLLPQTSTTLSTEVKHKNCNPKWNETFEFEEYPYQVLKEMLLFLQVLDYDRFSKDDPIGEIKIPMSRFDLVAGQKLWKNLGYSQGKTAGRLGDLLVELSYDCPQLTISIVRAKHLKALDINGTSDPYVKVWLRHDNQRQHKQTTTTKYNCLDPVYNEVIHFDVPIEKIRHVSLEVSVMDYDRFGRDETIGRIVLGSKTAPEQLKHWNDMFQHPRKTTAKWHVLRAYE